MRLFRHDIGALDHDRSLALLRRSAFHASHRPPIPKSTIPTFATIIANSAPAPKTQATMVSSSFTAAILALFSAEDQFVIT
jgi:hypothetical protein